MTRAPAHLLAATLGAAGMLAGTACSKQPSATGAVPVAARVADASARVVASKDQSGIAKKRAAPETVEPVVVGNVRYEAIVDGKARGLGQNGGILAAVDTGTGAELWLTVVYPIAYKPNLEADKQDIFITEIVASPDGKALIVTDERGRRWRVDLATRKSGPDKP